MPSVSSETFTFTAKVFAGSSVISLIAAFPLTVALSSSAATVPLATVRLIVMESRTTGDAGFSTLTPSTAVTAISLTSVTRKFATLTVIAGDASVCTLPAASTAKAWKLYCPFSSSPISTVISNTPAPPSISVTVPSAAVCTNFTEAYVLDAAAG